MMRCAFLLVVFLAASVSAAACDTLAQAEVRSFFELECNTSVTSTESKPNCQANVFAELAAPVCAGGSCAALCCFAENGGGGAVAAAGGDNGCAFSVMHKRDWQQPVVSTQLREQLPTTELRSVVLDNVEMRNDFPFDALPSSMLTLRLTGVRNIDTLDMRFPYDAPRDWTATCATSKASIRAYAATFNRFPCLGDSEAGGVFPTLDSLFLHPSSVFDNTFFQNDTDWQLRNIHIANVKLYTISLQVLFGSKRNDIYKRLTLDNVTLDGLRLQVKEFLFSSNDAEPPSSWEQIALRNITFAHEWAASPSRVVSDPPPWQDLLGFQGSLLLQGRKLNDTSLELSGVHFPPRTLGITLIGSGRLHLNNNELASVPFALSVDGAADAATRLSECAEIEMSDNALTGRIEFGVASTDKVLSLRLVRAGQKMSAFAATLPLVTEVDVSGNAALRSIEIEQSARLIKHLNIADNALPGLTIDYDASTLRSRNRRNDNRKGSPSFVPALATLRTLDASGNRFGAAVGGSGVSFVDGVAPHLTSLRLARCELSNDENDLRLPERLASRWPGLVSLDLSGNHFTRLPPVLLASDMLERLHEVYLNANDFTHLPLGLADAFPSVTTLKLADQQLEENSPRVWPPAFKFRTGRSIALRRWARARDDRPPLEVNDFLPTLVNPDVDVGSPSNRRELWHSEPQFRGGTLDLAQSNLVGTLPEPLDAESRVFEDESGGVPHDETLSAALRVLRLSFNTLTGALPAAFSRLKLLEELHLSTNKLEFDLGQALASGGVLSSLGALHTIDVSFNAHVTGELRSVPANVHTLYIAGSGVTCVTADVRALLSPALLRDSFQLCDAPPSSSASALAPTRAGASLLVAVAWRMLLAAASFVVVF